MFTSVVDFPRKAMGFESPIGAFLCIRNIEGLHVDVELVKAQDLHQDLEDRRCLPLQASLVAMLCPPTGRHHIFMTSCVSASMRLGLVIDGGSFVWSPLTQDS